MSAIAVQTAAEVFGETDTLAAPSLGDAAYHGITGEIVRLIEPNTESSVAAVLIQTLAMAGSAMGRRPQVRVEASRHGTNLYTLIVGKTSRSRKGTSFDQAQRPIALADPVWAAERKQSGLSSGEGLIHAIRDPITKLEDRVETTIDPGVPDKRLLIVEGEMASTLRVMARSGNTLSAILRQGWDGVQLKVMAKNSPGAATDPHISIIGHITEDELLRELTSTDQSNGFANRFLFIQAERSKLLPEGGASHLIDWAPIVRHLDAALDYARQLKAPMERDAAARELWVSTYEQLTGDHPGMLGAVTSRAEAHVTRLALIYAALDCSKRVTVEHLRAALAVWAYSEASCRRIFGEQLGDPDADTILAAIRNAGEHGLTRTDINRLFKGHAEAARISRALEMLNKRGLARECQDSTGGRPAKRWVAI